MFNMNYITKWAKKVDLQPLEHVKRSEKGTILRNSKTAEGALIREGVPIRSNLVKFDIP